MTVRAMVVPLAQPRALFLSAADPTRRILRYPRESCRAVSGGSRQRGGVGDEAKPGEEIQGVFAGLREALAATRTDPARTRSPGHAGCASTRHDPALPARFTDLLSCRSLWALAFLLNSPLASLTGSPTLAAPRRAPFAIRV